MKSFVFEALCILIYLRSSSCEELGNVFLVLMTDQDASGNPRTFVLEDNYCLDPVLPRQQSSCRIRVLAPLYSEYSNSRILNMGLDFQHPSRPNTACHVRWPRDGDVRAWCERTRFRNLGGRLPAFRSETVSTGNLDISDLIVSERSCDYMVHTIRYYRDGLRGFPERRPTVVFQTRKGACVAGIVSGRRVNNFRTTEAPCVYNGRRRCRPLRKDQYDKLLRDVEASDTYADFRTTSNRPHLRGG